MNIFPFRKNQEHPPLVLLHSCSTKKRQHVNNKMFKMLLGSYVRNLYCIIHVRNTVSMRALKQFIEFSFTMKTKRHLVAEQGVEEGSSFFLLKIRIRILEAIHSPHTDLGSCISCFLAKTAED